MFACYLFSASSLSLLTSKLLFAAATASSVAMNIDNSNSSIRPSRRMGKSPNKKGKKNVLQVATVEIATPSGP